ncbi:MAG: pyridoxamine 5'-phosphate oxidase family protein [Thermoleophilia bacterium]
MTQIAAHGFRTLTLEDVRATLGHPADLTPHKVRPRLDAPCRAFIARSPFLTLATMNAAGDADVSPRGDPPGFVKVLDDNTLVIPERPGNRLIDSLSNILETGSVGLLFVVPGVEETLRVNGRATITDDPELLATMEVKGKPPRLAIVVRVEQAFVHCAKAFKRSQLWDPALHVPRKELPSIGEMIKEQIDIPEMTAKDIDDFAEDDYRTNMY